MDDPGLDRTSGRASGARWRTTSATIPPTLCRSSTRSWAGCWTRAATTDPVVWEGDEREVVAEYLAAHEIAEAAERDADDLSPGDVAAAISGYRAVFEHLVTTRATAGVDLHRTDEA